MTPPPRRVSRPQASDVLLFAAPVLHLLVTAGGWAATSEMPSVLGRYSAVLAAFNAWNVALLALFALSYPRRAPIGLSCAYLGIAVTSFVVPYNNELSALPAIGVILPLVRLCAGVALAFTAFRRFRDTRRFSRPILGLSAVLVLVGALDLVLLGFVTVTGRGTRGTEADSGFRDAYDLSKIDPADVVLVGDSFVWGEGVDESQRMGNALQKRYADAGEATRVYSLGIIGVGPRTYLRVLEALPESARAGRVVLAYYMNDIPAIPNAHDLVLGLFSRFRRGSMTLGFVGDKIATAMVRDVDAYHRFVVSCYDHHDPTWPARWAELRSELGGIRNAVARHSDRPPIFLILPLVVDYRSYPLREAHRELAQTAAALGFEPLDMLPVFEKEFVDGTRYRCSPNDNHFNAQGHARVAQALWDRLHADSMYNSTAFGRR